MLPKADERNKGDPWLKPCLSCVLCYYNKGVASAKQVTLSNILRPFICFQRAVFYKSSHNIYDTRAYNQVTLYKHHFIFKNIREGLLERTIHASIGDPG